MRAAFAAALAALVLGACGRAEEAAPPPAKASPPAGTLALGERITSPLVPLSAIAKDPASYRNRVVATSGKVTSVCQAMGCWMELQDATGQAHVRMHGHSFFVPKTSPGHVARVQATVLDATSAGAACNPSEPGMAAAAADDCEAKAAGGVAKMIQLDATGVEID